MASLTDRYKKQAQQQAAVKYGPQRSALLSALQDLVGQRDAAISAAHAAGSALRASIDASVPQVAQGYDESAQRLSGAFGDYAGAVRAAQSGAPQGPATTVSQLLAGLGPAAQSIVAATLSGENVAQQNIAQARQASLNDLQRQRTGSAAGEGQSVRAANDAYSQGAAKVIQQLTDLGSQQGADAASILGDLVDKARQRAVTKRGQDLTAKSNASSLAERTRHDQTTERIAQQNANTSAQRAAGKAKAAPRLSLQQQNAAHDSINTAEGFVKSLRQQGVPDQLIRSALQTGTPITNSDSTVKPIKVPRTASEYIDAAFELSQTGKVSAATAKRLRARGFQIPGAWLGSVPGNIAPRNQTGSGLIP